MHTQFTEESKMATALTPQAVVTFGKSSDWWRTRDYQPVYRKYQLKTQLKMFLNNFVFIKSETSDSFVNHFDGHFAYLKTLDFYFNTDETLQLDL